MNLLQTASRNLIKKTFHTTVWLIGKFQDTAECDNKTKHLRQFAEGTVGHAIVSCLEQHQLRLIPGFESHDLKHVLLDFKMTPEDEIRLQAFMLGNGNFSLVSVAIFSFGAVLLPDRWSLFYRDFLRGSSAKSISSWTIEEYAHCDLLALRECVMSPSPAIVKSKVKWSLLYKFTILVMGSGIAGMLYCLPYMFSASIVDVVGAGLAFIAGAILTGAGLITLKLKGS